MQLVINIPVELYEANIRGLEAGEVWDLRVAVKNGTPLPKGHGRLIDADALRADYSFCWDGEELLSVNSLIIAPTIIDADKTESEL